MNKFLHFIVYKPKLSLFMGFLLILAFGFGLNKLHDDFGYRTWFLEEDPNLKAFDRFEQTFGSDEMSIISVYHPDGIFRKETINVIQKLTYDLWRAPEVIRVDSLSNYNWVHSENDDILVEPFFPDEIDITQNLLDKRKQVALTHPSIINYLINKEADTSLIYVNLKPTLGGSPDYKKVVLAFRDIVKKYNGLDNHKVYVAGNPVMNYAFREAAYMDMEHLMPFVVLLTIGLLWFLFRRPSGFVLPILIVGLSTIMTIGLSGWINIPIHSLTSIVPEFMMAIGVAVAIHLLSTFFIFYKEGTSKEEALKITLKKIFFPTILTSVSTSVGFFSFATSSIPTVGELGILTGFGTIFCWLTSYIILVPLIMLTPLKPSKTSPSDINIKDLEPSPKATMYAKWIFKYKYYIIAAFSSLSLLGFYYSLQLNVNSDPLAYFSKSYPLTVATNFVEEKLKSATAVEMIIETHKPEGAKDPEFLKKVNHFIQWIEAKPYVTKTSSIVEIIKDINKTLHEENPAFYDIPDTTDLIGQQLFLYTMNLPQGMDINNRITINNDAIRLTAMWTIHDSDTSLKYIKEWEHQAKILGLDMKATGKYVLYQSINDKVVSSFLTSITIALLFISFLLIAGLKSITLGLVSLIPNTTPLFIGAGIAKLMGQPLDIGTVIVGSVCLGIAVDDTIHFLAQFGEFTKKGDDSVRATSKVFTYTLPALITTTIVLVASFATFILADFIPNRNFGMFVAIILAIALLADIVFLPALMMALDEKHERFKQKKKEKIRT